MAAKRNTKDHWFSPVLVCLSLAIQLDFDFGVIENALQHDTPPYIAGRAGQFVSLALTIDQGFVQIDCSFPGEEADSTR
jgi:hypothetical protein